MDHSKTGLFGLDFEWFSLDRFIKKTIFSFYMKRSRLKKCPVFKWSGF